MSKLFLNFEEECASTLRSVSRRISEITSSSENGGGGFGAAPSSSGSSGPGRARLIADAEAQLRGAKKKLSQMESELSSIDAKDRVVCQAKLRRHRADLVNLTRDLQRAKREGERSSLFGARNSSPSRQNRSDTGDFHMSAARATETLRTTGDRVHASRQLVNESEEIGVNIMGNMHEQRETLLSAQQKVKETSNLASEAGAVLKRMAWRALYNQCLLYGIIILLVVCIGLVLYFMYIK